MSWRKNLAYALNVIVLANTNVLTISALLGVSNASYARAASETPLLDELKSKYSIEQPNNRIKTDRTYSETIPARSRDLTQDLIRGLGQTFTPVDLSSHLNSAPTPTTQMNSALTDAYSIGQTHGAPAFKAGTNDVKVSYKKEGTVELVRDENGNQVLSTKSNASSIEMRDGGIGMNEMLSAELNHVDQSFEADQKYGDENALFQEGRDTNQRLRTSGSITGDAAAYRTIINSSQQAANTNVDDAILQPSYDHLNETIEGTNNYFEGCTNTTTVVNDSFHAPEIHREQCSETTADNNFACSIEREVRIPAVVGGDGFRSCGVGCYELEIGQDGDNYYNAGGACRVFSTSKTVDINLADGIELQSVTASGGFDDHISLHVNGGLAFSVVDGGFAWDRPLPGASHPTCELSSNNSLGGTNVTYGVKRHIAGSGFNSYSFNLSTLVGDQGEANITLQFRFADSEGRAFADNILQVPDGCMDRVDNTYVANGGVQTMLDNGWSLDAMPYSFCRFDNYVVTEEGARGFPQEFLDVMQPMFPGDTGDVSWMADLNNYKCDPFGNQQYCFIDPDTEVERCLRWDDVADFPDFCGEFRGDPQCREVERECTEGWYDAENDRCFNETVIYECDRGQEIPVEYETTTSSCDAMLPCSGGDCEWGSQEQNGRFNEVVGKTSLLQHMEKDRSCTDAGDASTCRIFEGELEYCGWETTGLGMDCCEDASGVSIVDYVQAATLSWRLDSYLTADVIKDSAVGARYGELRSPVVNGFDTLKDTITSSDAWKKVAEKFTSEGASAAGKATGAVTDAIGQVQDSITALMDQVKQQLMEFVYEALPTDLAEMFLTETVTGVGEDATTEYALSKGMGNAANFMGYVMAAYTAYQLVKLALTLISACDDNEQDMGVKLAQRQCFSIGNSYCHTKILGICLVKRQNHCCYSSMLARIVMEQAAPMLGKDMSACEGMTQTELASIDFNNIDLSEWIGIMHEAGVVPENTEQSLTGSGRVLNSQNRETTAARTQARFNGIDTEQVYRDTKNAARVPMVDCNASPRPPVCEFQFSASN